MMTVGDTVSVSELLEALAGVPGDTPVRVFLCAARGSVPLGMAMISTDSDGVGIDVVYREANHA